MALHEGSKFGDPEAIKAGKMAAKNRALSGKLDPRQEKFCQAMATGNRSQEAAAIEAGYAPKSAQSQASRLMRQPHIDNRIRQIVREAGLRNEVSQDEVISWLRKVRDTAYQNNQLAVARQASVDLAKFLGNYKERFALELDVPFSPSSDADKKRMEQLSNFGKARLNERYD